MATRIPVNFGDPARGLVGIYQPAPPGGNQETCALLCNPFGQEAIRSQRMYRVLSDRLSRSGVPVLRFDYYATGDSSGDDLEGDIEGWIADISSAHAELLRRSSRTRCSWFGLRLGASLAALASAKVAGAPPGLVLWDPVIDGSGYLGDLGRAHLEGAKASWGPRFALEESLRQRTLTETETEALGFPLTPRFKAQLEGMTIASYASVRATRVTLFGEREGRHLAPLERALAGLGLPVAVRSIQSETDWTTNEAMSSAIAPFGDVQNVASAMSES